MLAFTAALALGLGANPTGDSVTFRFAWPDPLAAEVQYRRSRQRTGRPLTETSLRGRLLAQTRGSEIRVGYRDWRSVDGVPLDPLVEAAGWVETVVTPGGAFVRMDGIEPALEAMRATMQSAPPEARPMLERLEKMAPALLAKEGSETWSMLVQFWHGNDLDVGEDYQSDSEMPVAVVPGEKVRLRARIRVERRLACASGGGSCVEARMRSEPDPQDVARVMKRIVGELGLPAAQLQQVLGEMAAVTEVVLVTEPARLIPHRLEKTRTVRVAPGLGAPKGVSPVEGRDTSVWTFTYPAAPTTAPRGASNPPAPPGKAP